VRESAVWKYLGDHLPQYIEAERIEVMTPPGMSDVFWTDTRTSISGWLELKYCEQDNAELLRGRIPKLKPEQPMFLRRQAAKHVPSGILMRVGQDTWYFWRADGAREWVERIRGTEAIQYADRVWDRGLDAGQLFLALGCPCDV
jgi:hypothetical protein